MKTEKELNEFRLILCKITVETTLNAELEEHLGYARHESSSAENSRNGYFSKTLSTDDGTFELSAPCDRQGNFEPLLVKKNQIRFTSFDDKILWLYGKGMSTREAISTFQEMYGVNLASLFTGDRCRY